MEKRKSKIGRKTITLNFWNNELEGKTTTLIFWNQKLEGNSTTPKNCVLTNFLHERSIIFLQVFSLIRLWILLRNEVWLLTGHLLSSWVFVYVLLMRVFYMLNSTFINTVSSPNFHSFFFISFFFSKIVHLNFFLWNRKIHF